MRKEDKTELTKERIINAALEEFGTKGYSAASLSNICAAGISKGLIYHNFKNKDEVYLSCIKRSFLSLTNYLKSQNVGCDMQKYMKARLCFFTENEFETRLFFEALLQPPIHLAEEIKELKKEFDSFNREIYKKIIADISLREGVNEVDALEYFTVMQDMFNGYFSSPAYKGIPISDLIAKHETTLSNFLDFMLFGVAERGDK